MASFAGWDSNLFTGTCPDLPTNGDIYMHSYTITYSNESGVNNAVLHADILSPMALRPSESEHLGSARFESLIGHWLLCVRVLSFLSVLKRKISNNFSYFNQCGPVLSAICDVIHTFHTGHPHRKCPEKRGLLACTRITVVSSTATTVISLKLLQNCEILTIIRLPQSSYWLILPFLTIFMMIF
jgi:hypothetical protein